jgi:hypothetical protein
MPAASSASASSATRCRAFSKPDAHRPLGRSSSMRASVALVALSLLVLVCSSSRGAAGDGGSLAQLRHLTAEQQNFGVILDAKNGRALAAFRVDNPIRAAIPDGNGGWYIGGGFVRVDGVLRKRLAHIDEDGRLDPDWKPEANGNGVSVTALARIGSQLYVAGDFARLQQRPRFHFGALDLATRRLLPWRPQPRQPLDGRVLLTAGDRVIAGGGSCCSEAGSAVYGLEAGTGAIDPTWKPHVGPTTLTGSGVYALASGGRGVLIRGLFGRPRGRVVVGETDPQHNRLVRKWRPAVSKQCLWCTLMAAAIGSKRVFASVNGSAAYPLVAFSRRTGAVDSRWRAQLSSVTGFYGAVSASAVAIAGGRVYVTGDFDHVGGVRRNGFAALDQARARVLRSWEPAATTVYGSLLAPSRDRLLLGISLARELRFNFTGLKTYRSVRTLRLTLALSGPGSVRISLGRGCNTQRWLNSGRCTGRLIRHLSTVRFTAAARERYIHHLGVARGRYFIRFVPITESGVAQLRQDFPITVR